MRSSVLVATLVALLPLPAAATVGGPTVVEVVGWAPVDRKIYWVEREEDASDSLPRLFFVRTDGAHAGEAIAVKSWYRGDAASPSEEDRADFDRRLERLRSHLVPMTDAKARWKLDTKVGRARTWHGEPFGFGDRRGHDVRCELTHETGRSIAASVTVTVYDKPRVRIADAFEVPGKTAGVVVLRYLGDPFETGYDVDTVVPTRSP